MRRQRGFTLLELMITIAIVGVMATMAVGLSGTLFRKSRLNQLARGIYTAVSVARAEAVRGSRHTVVAISSDRVTAFVDATTGTGTAWKYDAGTDTKLFEFLFSDASIKPSDLTLTTTNLTTSAGTTTGMDPSFIFTSAGYCVRRTSTTAYEQLIEASVTVKHNGIPASQNVFRTVAVTPAGAIRVTSR
jgi:type II secretion system protein H